MKNIDRFDHIIECIYKPWLFLLFNTEILAFIKRKKLQKYLKFYFKLRFLLKRKPILPIVEYVVTTNCTMKCKECNTLIPHFDQNSHLKEVHPETFKSDLDKLLSAVDFIYALGLVGGEPLLNQDLPNMLAYALRQKKIKHIFIATNCTIEPSTELIQSMKHKKFAIQLSNYKNVIGSRSKFDKIQSALSQEGILFSLPHGGGEGGSVFIKMPRIEETPGTNTKMDFADCICKNCAPFFDGLFLPCTVSVYIVANGNIPESIRKRVIDVRALSSEELSRRLNTFYTDDAGIFCPYCDWECAQMTTFAEQK